MEEVKDISPWAAALMTAGGNILANNRPGVSYGSAIGSGISSFSPAFYATKGAQDRQKYIDTLQKYKQLEFDAEQQKAQQEAAQKARFNSAIQSGEAFQGMPQDQVETINRAYKIGGDELARKVFETYSTREPNKPDAFELFLQGDPRAAQWKQMGVPRSTNNINVNMPAMEKAFQESQGKGFGTRIVEDYTKAQDAVQVGRARNKAYQALDQLLGDEGGAFEQNKLNFVKGARAIGLDVGDPEKIGRQEAAVALGKKMALDLKDLVPGPMSDGDRDYLDSIPPSIATTPEGRKKLIEIDKKLTERNEEVAKVYRENFRRNGGKVTIDVYDELDKLAQKDMFTSNDPTVKKSSSAVGQRENEQKQRFVFDPATGELVPK